MGQSNITFVDPQKYAPAIAKVIEAVTESFKSSEDIARVLEGCIALCIKALKEETGRDTETLLRIADINIRSWLLEMESATQGE